MKNNKHYNKGKNHPRFGENKYHVSRKFLEKGIKIKSISIIAKEIGCSNSTIRRYLKKYNIKKIKASDILTKKFLIKEYSKKEKPASKIAKKLNCSVTPIYTKLKLYGIPIRKIGNFKHTIKTKQLLSQLAKHRKGKKASNYIDGRTLKKYYCKCGNEITYQTWKYGKGMCIECANKQSKNKGQKNRMFGKSTPHGKNDKYKGIYMRSSYEIAYARYLDKNNIKWLYEPKRFSLGESTYCPDFYIPKWDLYIEIKGWRRDDAKKKFKLFRKLYPNIEIKILNYNSLKELEII